MRFSQSRPSFAILGAAGWVSGLASGAEGRPSSATPPPPYPETRTLVKLHPAQVNPLLQDPDYELWEIGGGGGSEPAGKFGAKNGLNFTIRATNEHDGLVGDAFASVYTRPLPDVGQRLVGSGITTESDGGSITLTIFGLPVGEHWLSTWHNAWKDLGNDIPSVALTINGDSGISGRPQTSQEDNRYGDALIHSWTTFTVDGHETEVIYNPRGGNVYLNGFEIDSESMGRQIRFPKPAHRDDQVAAPSGVVSASWQRTFSVDGDEFNVYIGTSPDDMRLVGSRVHEPEFNLTGLAAGRTYYWRVDVYDTWWNEVLSGRTLTFTTV